MQTDKETISERFNGHELHRFNSIVAYPCEDMTGDVIVEIGPGRGDFLFHLAEQNPDKAIYGIEIKGKRFDKLVRRRDKRKLSNIKVVLADAAIALPEIFEASSIDAIYINFPDPWPKEKHAKKRLLRHEFLKNCLESLKDGGALYITTDVERYAQEVSVWCQAIPEFSSVYGGISTESDEAYPTLFAEKWKAEGRTIYYQKYVKGDDPVPQCHGTTVPR